MIDILTMFIANTQVFAVFHSRVICRSVSPKFIVRALYGDAMFVSFRGAQIWRLYSNRNICHRVLLLKRKIIALDILYMEINASTRASTV